MSDDERLLEIATRLIERQLDDIGWISAERRHAAWELASVILKEWRERTGAREERGQDVSVEMLQRAAVACRSAAAMWSAIPTKNEYWCETADYFDKRARAAGKGEE